MERNYKGNAEIMGKKIQCIGRYVMDGVTLGKGNFAKVELATHSVTGCKVSCCCFLNEHRIPPLFLNLNIGYKIVHIALVESWLGTEIIWLFFYVN